MNKRFLILSPSEINYNPRLLKAADYLQERGERVTVYNAVTGISSYELYADVVNNRAWTVIENRMDKSSFTAKLKWLYRSILQKVIRYVWSTFKLELGSMHYMQKGLINAKIDPHEYDVVIIHLVDSLPYAVSLKEKNKKLKIVYDSQEFFRGQYENEQEDIRRWVHTMEPRYIHKVDFIMATTEVMKKRIHKDYGIQVPMFKVRNVPYVRQEREMLSEQEDSVLKVVWHGMTIIYGNRRGLQTIVTAISHCKTPVQLYLQGLKRDKDMLVLKAELARLNITDQVTIVPPAHPDRIVESLVSYDIGVCAEIPEEENQQLTSSNKLFEYIGAGLCGVVSDVPGLVETLDEYDVGLIFEPANAKNLAERLDQLNADRTLLRKYKNNARKAAFDDLYWEHDYHAVYEAMIN